jgi:hypothetical protein
MAPHEFTGLSGIFSRAHDKDYFSVLTVGYLDPGLDRRAGVKARPCLIG